MVGLYMVLWGKSKEMKKVTHLEITSDTEKIEIVVSSNTEDRNDINRNNNVDNNSKIEGQEAENNGKEELVSSLQVKSWKMLNIVIDVKYDCSYFITLVLVANLFCSSIIQC